MTSDEAVLAVLDALEAGGVDYMVVGSLSSNLYGLPDPPATPTSSFSLPRSPFPI